MAHGDALMLPLQAQSLASARVCQGTDRPPSDTAGAAGHLEGRGSATRASHPCFQRHRPPLSEPPRWGARAGIPNSSKLPADFNWRFCPRQDWCARPGAFLGTIIQIKCQGERGEQL